MLKPTHRVSCALVAGLVLTFAGCAYDGSQFQYQSGGIPFLGMSLAVGNDANTDAQVVHADGSGGLYAPDPKPSVLSRIPEAIRRFRAPTELNVPEGTERVLSDKYSEELNAF